jgi:hypothetical protein
MFSNTNTLQGIQNGKTLSKIEASTLATNGTNVPATNFAYSIWFYVNDFNYRHGEPKVIFGRMDTPSVAGSGSVTGIPGTNPCPLVVLGAYENNIEVSLTYNSVPPNRVKKCTVKNVPIQKWTNLIISVYGRTLDTYLDGKLVNTCLLPGIAKVKNDSNIYVTPYGGFDGWTSNFQYFPNPLNIF